jgi:NAD(P)H-hydrate epimerase
VADVRLVTPAEMRLLERRCEADYGLASVLLMENAGARAAEVAVRMLDGGQPGRVVVVAGKGANGGDGCVLARHLAGRGYRLELFLLGRETELRGDALASFLILAKMSGPDLAVHQVIKGEDLPGLSAALSGASLVVDALFGTGLHGSVTGLPLAAIGLINKARRPVLALDAPSGVDAGTGQVLAGEGEPGLEGAVRAATTVTFGLPKLGLFLYPGASYTGELVVADIGLPAALLSDPALKMHLITPEQVRRSLPSRPADAHKGSFGHALLVGGSPGLTGAVALAGEAALRAGAGKATVAVPESLNAILEVKLTEAMSLPVAETPGHLVAPAAAETLVAWAGRCQAAGLGGGLGTAEGPGEFLRDFLAGADLPVVLDADALRLMGARPELFRELLAGRRQPAVLTPHPGEMAALMGLPVDAVERYRVDAAREVSQSWHAVLVLKGAHTVIATPDGELHLNPTGNAGLATGGTGDVLTGVITSLLAQGMAPAPAAVAGVYLHGLAGDLAAAETGLTGMMAGDVIRRLPAAIQQVQGTPTPWRERKE